MKYYIFFMLSYFLVSLGLVNAQLEKGQTHQEVDSLKHQLYSASGIEKIELYGALCFTFAGTLGDVVMARNYADSLHALALELNDKKAIAISRHYYGLVGRYDGNYATALDHLQAYLAYSDQEGDLALKGKTLYQMGVINDYLGNFDRSLEIYYKMLAFYDDQKDVYGKGLSLMTIGVVLVDMNRYHEAITYFEKALHAFNTLDETLQVKMGKLRSMMNTGNAYIFLNEYSKAKIFYSRSLVLSTVLGSQRTLGTCLSSLGEIASATGNYDSALYYHRRALALREHNQQQDKILLSLLRVGETYMFKGIYSSALTYLNQGLYLAKNLSAKPGIRDAYRSLAQLSAFMGDYQKAYEYHQLYSTMSDQVLNERTTKRLNELQTQYQVSEKDKRIALLDKENQQKENEALRQAFMKRLLILGLLLVFLLATLIIYAFYQRLRNQKILTKKNMEIKDSIFKQKMSELEIKALQAQINPHFFFNCMNSINHLIVSGEVDSASLYLTKFSRMVRSILETMESKIIPLEEELKMITAYVQLEELRFKGTINFHLEVVNNIDIQSICIPSMILQPFIENAIWHGLRHKRENMEGRIYVSIEARDNFIHCTIEDNGIGREMARHYSRKSLWGHKSLGLRITEERLKLFHDEKDHALIKITDLKGEAKEPLGTRIEVDIPVEI